MKLYYLTKEKNDNYIYIGNTEHQEHFQLYLFNELQLFGNDVMETYDENIPDVKYWIKDKRIFSIYSLEIDNLPTNYKLTNSNFYHVLEDLNKKYVNDGDNEDIELYKQTLRSLNLKFEKKICIDRNKIILKFNFSLMDELIANKIKNLIKIILTGDSPINCLRLYNIANVFNVSPQFATKEIYDILYSFTLGDYYDLNAEGPMYYDAMKILREKYYTDPRYKI